MPYLIVSNDGNWDDDMWGVVGVLPEPSVDALKAFICKREHDNSQFVMVEVSDDIDSVMEKYEVNFLCEGEVIFYMIEEKVNYQPIIFFVVALNS